MELSPKNEEKKNPLQNADVSLDGTKRASYNDEIGKKLSWGRFNPDVRIAEGMMWHPPRKKTSQNPQNRQSGPTWGFLFGQIILGLAEILIPFFPQVSTYISPPTATRFYLADLPLHFSQLHSQRSLESFLR